MLAGIVYESNSGFTKQYAEMLSAAAGIPALPLVEAVSKIPRGSEVFFLGWAYLLQSLSRAAHFRFFGKMRRSPLFLLLLCWACLLLVCIVSFEENIYKMSVLQSKDKLLRELPRQIAEYYALGEKLLAEILQIREPC